MNFTVDIYCNLNNKYQSQFNFHFSKSVNQIIFNQTIAKSTISFKDAVIFAESVQYLKRHYFIINQIGIQEIFERIGMLANFYASAVLLRFQYPMMIVTKTKQVFLKRLKRNKKILTQEGSSDQSKSNTLSRSIQLHTNTFLDSVNSSQLSKKTAQLRDQLFPQFKERQNTKPNRIYDQSIHDIHNPLPSFDNSQIKHKNQSKKQQILEQQSFADKLMKLSKNISLNQMINQQAVQINLNFNQNDLSYMICDFDQIDKQLTVKNYQKIKSREKDKENIYQKTNQDQEWNHLDRFRKKAKMGIMALDSNQQYLNHQKTLQNPKSRRLPKQMQFSAIDKQIKMKQPYVPQHRNHPKMSAFYQTKNSLLMDKQDERYNQHEQSYKTLQRFRPSHNFLKQNQHELKHIYNNKNNIQNYSRGKANSHQQNYLPRHRSNNVFNIKKPMQYEEMQNINEKRKDYPQNIQHTDPYNNRRYQPLNVQQIQNYNHQRYSYINGYNSNDNPGRYSIKNKSNHLEDRYITQFQLNQQNQRMNLNSPRFAQPNEQQLSEENFSINSRHNQSKLPTESIMGSHLPITNQKYYRVFNSRQRNQLTRHRNIEDTNMNIIGHSYQKNHQQIKQQNQMNNTQQLTQMSNINQINQQSMQQRQQKKKRIRQKAAQLLSRVKSHQYLTARVQMEYQKRY